MYGQEIARVHAHDNGYTVETKTKKASPRKDAKGNTIAPFDSHESDPMPGHTFESSVAQSRKELLDRVGAAYDKHQEVKLRGQYQKLSKK